MSEITSISLRDVRCFAGEQTARFGRKVTLIVGENSTGKSTLLGCYKAFAELCGAAGLRDDGANYFDGPPLALGDYDAIARKGGADFSVGGDFRDHWLSKARFEFTRGENAAPVDSRMTIGIADSAQTERQNTPKDTTKDEAQAQAPDLSVTGPLGLQDHWEFQSPPNLRFEAEENAIPYYRQPSSWLFNYACRGELPYRGSPERFAEARQAEVAEDRDDFRLITALLKRIPHQPNGTPAFPVAAVAPEMPPRQRLYSSPPINTTKEMANYLAERGKKLDLFSRVKVKEDRHGSELLVERDGIFHNIMDVGYGIHSALHLLIAVHGKPAGTTFLLQQPEVHLHPRAQALLAQLMAEGDHRFIIETHADGIIDRMRICVMKGEMSPEDSSVVYCEFSDEEKNASRIYNISYDEMGNMSGVPRGYRKFMSQEGNRLLGFPE